MAKLNSSIGNYSGKIGDLVHVAGNKNKAHVRKAVAPGRRKNEPAFKEQHSRTGMLNTLAGEINRVMETYCMSLRPRPFYRILLVRLRRERENNRFLLLRQLKGMEINESYKLKQLGVQTVSVKQETDKLIATLSVAAHPDEGKHNADCYYYELLLLTWTKSKQPPVVHRKLSMWIDRKGGRPEIEFEFPFAKGVVHWMLCVGCKLGLGRKEIGLMVCEGMRVEEVGTRDKKDLEVLKKREGVEGVGEEAVKGEVEDVERVAAKRWL